MEKTQLGQYRKLVLLAGGASVFTAVLFILIKFGVWMISSSTVIFASLTDSIFDLLASLVNLLALKFSLSPPDDEHRFGHHKSQSLASLAQAAFIGGSAVLLISHGIERCVNPVHIEHIDLALYVSIICIIFTVLLVLFQTYVFRKTQSEAIAADRLHYLSDVSLNIGVIIALFLSNYGYEWADGFFACCIGLFILKGAYQIGVEAVQTLLDRSLDPVSMNKIMQAIVRTEGVLSIHDLKTHSAGPIIFVQGHIVMDGKMSLVKAHNVVNEAELNIRKDFPDAEIILHMEPDEKETYETVNFDDSKLQQN